MSTKIKITGRERAAILFAFAFFAPLAVRPVGTFISSNQNAATTHGQEPWHSYEWATLLVLVFQAWIFHRQARIAERQRRLMRGQLGITKGQLTATEDQRDLMGKQLRAAVLSAETAMKQVDLARREFLATHRPKLHIHSVRLLPPRGDSAPEEQALRATFVIVNAGTSPAQIVSSLSVLEYSFPKDRRYLDRIRHNEVIPPIRLAVGEEKVVAITGDDDSGFIHWNENPAKVLYFYGWINYVDDLMVKRISYFGREWEPPFDRFTPISEPEAEATY